MKKIFVIFSAFVTGVFAVSCNINDLQPFDDANAFVEFDKTSASIDEDGKSIKIPVTLASVVGLEESISYEAVDGTAKAGENYELADGKATLFFNADSRTQYITVNIIDQPGKYTGDITFTLKFKSTGNVKPGMKDSCTITIGDNDHPLASILGTYSCTAYDYAAKAETSWTCTFTKDPKDVTVVWIDAIESQMAPSYPGKCTVYGIATKDEETGLFTISVPTNQEYDLTYSTYGALTLIHVDDTYDNYINSDIVFTEGPAGTLSTRDNYVIEAYYYFSWVCGGAANQYHPDCTTTFVKQ